MGKRENFYFEKIGKDNYWNEILPYLNSIKEKEENSSLGVAIIKTNYTEEISIKSKGISIGEFELNISGKNCLETTKNKLEELIK